MQTIKELYYKNVLIHIIIIHIWYLNDDSHILMTYVGVPRFWNYALES